MGRHVKEGQTDVDKQKRNRMAEATRVRESRERANQGYVLEAASEETLHEPAQQHERGQYNRHRQEPRSREPGFQPLAPGDPFDHLSYDHPGYEDHAAGDESVHQIAEQVGTVGCLWCGLVQSRWRTWAAPTRPRWGKETSGDG